jgi:hypothetical protein
MSTTKLSTEEIDALNYCMRAIAVVQKYGTLIRADRIRELAVEEYHDDGTIEIDPNAKVSEGNENGAYVQAWVWVDFAGTDLDREKPAAGDR